MEYFGQYYLEVVRGGGEWLHNIYGDHHYLFDSKCIHSKVSPCLEAGISYSNVSMYFALPLVRPVFITFQLQHGQEVSSK